MTNKMTNRDSLLWNCMLSKPESPPKSANESETIAPYCPDAFIKDRLTLDHTQTFYIHVRQHRKALRIVLRERTRILDLEGGFVANILCEWKGEGPITCTTAHMLWSGRLVKNWNGRNRNGDRNDEFFEGGLRNEK